MNSKSSETAFVQQEEDSDERLLRQMGYTQELYRGLSPFMAFSFSFTAVNVFTAISITFPSTIIIGGSGMAIWSWIIGSIFTILTSISLAEICSVYPSAGSVYHWSGKLVSPRHAPLASFICGWLNFIGNVAGLAAFSSGFATILNSALLVDGKSLLNVGAQVGIGIAIAFLWAILNILRIDQQGWLNNAAAIFQMGSVLSIIIVILVMAPQRATAYDVFISTYDGSGFPLGYVYCIGILSTLFSFSGYEAGAHLTEETRNAARAGPKSIVGTSICSAIIGFAYLLALFFVIPNIDTFIQTNSQSEQPIHLVVATYELATSRAGARGLTALLLLNLHFAGMSSTTVTSRIGFAMARDGILPFSKYLRWIFEPTKVPLTNIFFVFFINVLLLLLQLASTTAFTAIIAIATLGYQISYLMPIMFRFTTARHTFRSGEFSLGLFGVPIAVTSCVWLFITSVLMFFPTQYPVTKENMNYTIVIIGGITIIALIFWIVSARHWFVGPKRADIDPLPSVVYFTTNDSTMTSSINEQNDNASAS